MSYRGRQPAVHAWLTKALIWARTSVMTKKRKSMRLLDMHGVPYEVMRFSASIHSAAGVVTFLNLPASLVYKTLVVIRGQCIDHRQWKTAEAFSMIGVGIFDSVSA